MAVPPETRPFQHLNLQEGKNGRPPVNRSLSSITWISIILLVLASVIWIFSNLTLIGANTHQEHKDCSCGFTIEAAKQRNCTYDELAAAWLPQHCIDHTLSQEFARSGPMPDGSWQYYDNPDSNATLLSVDQVAACANTGDLVWVTKEWHIAHCLFYWRKTMRSKVTGVKLERRYAGTKHVDHCAMALLNRNFTLDMVETRFGVLTNT